MNKFIISLIALVAACSTSTPSTPDAGITPPAPSASTVTGDATPTKGPTANPAWYGQGPLHNPKLLGAGTQGTFPPPVFQASWLVTDWWIDPVSGSDTNTCITIGSPCQTYAQVAARLGTYSPRFRQTVTFHFISSQPDNTDPVYLQPYVENGATCIIKGELPAPIQTGTLGTTIAKNRATPQLLNTTLAGGAAIGELVVNTTHPSRAWTYQNTSGVLYNMTQPLVGLVPPFNTVSSGVEVDTWTSGDAYSVYVPYSVFVIDFEPLWTAGNSSNGTPGYIYQLIIPPDSASSQVTTFNDNVTMVESRDRSADTIIFGNGIQGTLIINDYNPNTYAFQVTVATNNNTLATLFNISAGITGSTVGSAAIGFNKDVIFNAGGSNVGVQNALMNDFYIETGNALLVFGPSQVAGPVWGPGTLVVQGSARLIYPAGIGAAAANFLLTGGFSENTSTTACSHSGATPDVVDCGITLTAAHLDAAQGAAGFGGLAYNPGGSSISNGGL